MKIRKFTSSLWVTAVALLALVGQGVTAGSAQAAGKKAGQVTPTALIKQLIALAPGKDRDSAIDALIDAGEAAWPEVKVNLGAIAGSASGEDVVVDLLLGFGVGAWDEILTRTAKMSDGAAVRIVRQVLRFPTDDRQVQLLLGLMNKTDEPLLLLILPELVAREQPTVLPRLIELVDDQRPGVRNYAIDTLVAKKSTAALPALVRRMGVERLRPTADNLTLRVKLINAIAHIGADTDAPVPPLFEALEIVDQREAVLDALQVVGAPAVRAATFLLQTAERARVETALIVLSHLRVQSAPELMPFLINARDETTRTLIADVLALLGVPQVRTDILRMIRERKFPDLRQGLLLALTLYDDGVRKLLLELLADPDVATRRMVVEQLWRLADPETFVALRNTATRDDEVGTRILTQRALVGMGDPKIITYLRKLAVVNNVEERLEVLRTLGRVDDESGLPVLAAQLSDPNDAVFRGAVNSLRRMTFHSGPRREGEWLAWAEAEKQRKPEKYEETEPLLRRFQIDGREMGWLEAGDSDDKAIVVIAGAPYRDATHLMPHVWQLADNYQVIVMQRGISVQTAASYSEKEFGQELTKLLQTLNKRPVALLADPSAAHFGLRYANEHPKDVAAVILHGGPWPTQAAMRKMGSEIRGSLQSPWQEDAQWAQTNLGLLTPAVAQRVQSRAMLSALLGDPEFGRRVKFGAFFDDGFSLEARDRAISDAGTWDPNKAQVPMLVLQGTKAPWSVSTLEAIEKLPAGVRKQMKLVRLDGVGSMPLVERAEAAVQAVRDFLK